VLPPAVLGPEAEPVQPVWVRSWEHDAESMPMGYGAVVCSIGREVKEEDGGKALHLKINAVNDYTDAEIAGRAELILPQGWKADRTEIAFALPPLGCQTTSVIVRRPDPSASGQIKLRHEYDGQVFQDVLEIGEAFNLEIEAQNNGDAIVVDLVNPTGGTIEAEISLVTPIETWSPELVGSLALMDISPRTQGVSLAPGEKIQLTFAVKPVMDRGLVPLDSYWAVVKLMSNGRIQLKRCDNHPPERRMWSEKWFRTVRGQTRWD
jgi:hypothetical protein